MSLNSELFIIHGPNLSIKRGSFVKHDRNTPDKAIGSPGPLSYLSKVSGSVLVQVAMYLDRSRKQSGHNGRKSINNNLVMDVLLGDAVWDGNVIAIN